MARRNQTPTRPKSASGRRDDATSGTYRWPLIGTMIAVFIAVWVAFFPALDNDFVSWDDPTYVTEQPIVLQPDAPRTPSVWRTPVSLNYHPLTMKTLAWNRRADEPAHPGRTPEARPFITMNIWLHALNALLVLLFIHRLTKGDLAVAAFCAVVFALHPMHVESVAWVSERKDVLYAFFFLAGLLTWQQWREKNGVLWYAVTMILFIASCLSKAMAVVFPLVLLLIDMWERRPLRTTRPWLEKAPLFGIALLFGLIALDVQRGGDFHGLLNVERALGSTVAVAEKLPYSTWEQLRSGSYGFALYLVKFLVPFGMGTFHPYPSADDKGALFLIAPFILLAVLLTTMWSLQKGRVVFFGIGFFTVCVILVLQFLPVGRALMAERYTYLAYIGLSFLAAMGISHLLQAHPARSRIWTGITVAVALLCIPFTRAQSDKWQNTRTLFRQVIAQYPKDPDAYANLGSWYGKRSAAERSSALLDSAGMVLTEGVRAGAVSGPLFEAMATYLGSQGRTDSALVWFDRAVEVGPVTGQLMHNRAMARYTTDPKGCLEDLERAIQLGHLRVGESYALRARARFRAAHYADAIEDVTIAMDRFGQQRPDAYLLRAHCHYQLGQRDAALKDAREVVRLDPHSAQGKELLNALGG